MNFSFWWLVVMAGVGYQVSAKEVAGGADPLASLVVTYLVASLTSFLIYAFTGKKGEKWKEIMSFRPAALALGLSIAFIEIGTIFIYKAGWTMNASFIVTNALITLCLILTGAGKAVTPAGIGNRCFFHWHMLHRVVRGTGQRERKTFTRFYGNAYGRWKRIAAR